MAIPFEVDRRERLSPKEFAELYVQARRPVHVVGGMRGCAASTRWTLDHLRRGKGDVAVPVKEWDGSSIKVGRELLRDYIDALKAHERDETAPRPAYLHDIPLTSLLPDAEVDLSAFPRDYFPAWYGAQWTNFAQLFLGPSGSVTPLHFDCLLTHNLFFQLIGAKRFTLIPHEQLSYCYPYNWRWCAVDVEAPDLERHPLYRHATPVEVVVEPGDVLYMPPGTLHHVRSLDCALSFNVDWHTRRSAIEGAAALLRGMPAKNVYYNLVMAVGLWGGVPPKRLMPYYRSYLNYVS
jgi:hypothetical protein